MALERIPADIRAAGGVSRMSDPKMIKGIQEAVSIPVMAKCRIGHFVEAQVLQAIDIDYIDESEVLSPADDTFHIDKTQFNVPFVCGARDLGEALRRIAEGATMIRTKGEPGTGDVIQAVRHMRMMNAEIRRVQNLRADELFEAAKTGALEEAWCIGTAAVISPIGALGWGDKCYEINHNRIGELSQKLYDELTGIQWGTKPDPFGWTCPVC